MSAMPVATTVETSDVRQGLCEKRVIYRRFSHTLPVLTALIAITTIVARKL